MLRPTIVDCLAERSCRRALTAIASRLRRGLAVLLVLPACALASTAFAAPVEPVLSLAVKEKPALLETLRELVSIESDSRNREGLDHIADLLARRLGELGGAVEFIEPEADVYKMDDTPEKLGKVVRATFTGTGAKKLLLLAHMDTVYPKGTLAKQPFRIEGNKAYGLGIADDKQGLALILHTISMLKALNFTQYGMLTVLFNGDEEISTPGSRALITKLGSQHDVVFSAEASREDSDKLALATAGIASVTLTVHGRASHAGAAPERGVNALIELAHQIIQTRDLSEPEIGLKMNWTLALAGTNRNVIPETAKAIADVRVLRVADYDRIEQKVRERFEKQLVPNAKLEVLFERRRPPLEATAASRAMGRHAQQIYRELGKELVIDEVAEGGGTDAAFAALSTAAPVLERFGLRGFGAHSAFSEYVLIDSIEPRLYLLARLIMDVSSGKAP
jgi:glutamate carboxypeptidase